MPGVFTWLGAILVSLYICTAVAAPVPRLSKRAPDPPEPMTRVYCDNQRTYTIDDAQLAAHQAQYQASLERGLKSKLRGAFGRNNGKYPIQSNVGFGTWLYPIRRGEVYANSGKSGNDRVVLTKDFELISVVTLTKNGHRPCIMEETWEGVPQTFPLITSETPSSPGPMGQNQSPRRMGQNQFPPQRMGSPQFPPQTMNHGNTNAGNSYGENSYAGYPYGGYAKNDYPNYRVDEEQTAGQNAFNSFFTPLSAFSAGGDTSRHQSTNDYGSSGHGFNGYGSGHGYSEYATDDFGEFNRLNNLKNAYSEPPFQNGDPYNS